MSAGQYRKRPVVVEAMRYGTNNGWQIRVWSKSAVIESPVLDHPTPDNPTGHYLQILTLEGMMSAGVGDWIIRGVKGEFYPCKHDISAPGAVLCGPCAASWWDYTRIRYAFARVPENELHGMCVLSFSRWAEKRSARCQRRAATRARHELRSVTAACESHPRIFEAPRRKGHTLAEIEELKRRGQW